MSVFKHPARVDQTEDEWSMTYRFDTRDGVVVRAAVAFVDRDDKIGLSVVGVVIEANGIDDVTIEDVDRVVEMFLAVK